MRQGAARMKTFIQSMQKSFDHLLHGLFFMLTEQNANSHIVRFAITFLDIWQAVIILNHNYWIPELINITTPIYIYSIFAVCLAILASVAMLFHRVLWLSAVVFLINTIMYMCIMIAAIWYYNPPRASFGFAAFVMLISVSAFWRKMLLIIRNRVITKRN